MEKGIFGISSTPAQLFDYVNSFILSHIASRLLCPTDYYNCEVLNSVDTFYVIKSVSSSKSSCNETLTAAFYVFIVDLVSKFSSEQ